MEQSLATRLDLLVYIFNFLRGSFLMSLLMFQTVSVKIFLISENFASCNIEISSPPGYFQEINATPPTYHIW